MKRVLIVIMILLLSGCDNKDPEIKEISLVDDQITTTASVFPEEFITIDSLIINEDVDYYYFYTIIQLDNSEYPTLTRGEYPNYQTFYKNYGIYLSFDEFEGQFPISIFSIRTDMNAICDGERTKTTYEGTSCEPFHAQLNPCFLSSSSYACDGTLTMFFTDDIYITNYHYEFSIQKDLLSPTDILRFNELVSNEGHTDSVNMYWTSSFMSSHDILYKFELNIRQGYRLQGFITY